MGIGFWVNFVVGVGLLVEGLLLIFRVDAVEPHADAIRNWLRKSQGDDFELHQAIIGGVFVLLSVFFVAVAFMVFAKTHHFWVLQWL